MNWTKSKYPDKDEVKAWLIEFEYEEYCQGYEWTWTYRLVYAKTFEDACQRILNKSSEFYNARNFTNCTIL